MIGSTFAVLPLLMMLIVGTVLALRKKTRRPSRRKVAADLRRQVLRLSPSDIGLSPAPGEAWGVVMDTTYPEGTASLISLADGTASIYFSSGGGVIGGQTHEAVAKAARTFVHAATEVLNKLGAAPDKSLPRRGFTRFFVLTSYGEHFAEAREETLGKGEHELSPLFHAGQDVITELRRIAET